MDRHLLLVASCWPPEPNVRDRRDYRAHTGNRIDTNAARIRYNWKHRSLSVGGPEPVDRRRVCGRIRFGRAGRNTRHARTLGPKGKFPFFCFLPISGCRLCPT